MGPGSHHHHLFQEVVRKKSQPALVSSWRGRAPWGVRPHRQGCFQPNHALPGQILPVTVGYFFFFPPETRLLSKSPCLKVSQSETACFNSQKPFGFLHCAVSTSLRFLWWQRPQRLRSATLPVCCIDDFQTKNPVISLPSSLTQYLQICKSYAGGPLPVIPSTVDIDFHNEQK